MPKADQHTLTEERVDAVTLEPLHRVKYIEITSPDGSSKLFYNTSTLIRIGMEKGGMLEPPHFREPMPREMLARIERLERRRIVIPPRINEQSMEQRRLDAVGEQVLMAMWMNHLLRVFNIHPSARDGNWGWNLVM